MLSTERDTIVDINGEASPHQGHVQQSSDEYQNRDTMVDINEGVRIKDICGRVVMNIRTCDSLTSNYSITIVIH